MTTNILDKLTSTENVPQRPLAIFREGAVAASVWSRRSSAGQIYLDFSLSRSWKSKSGDKEGYSQNFFESNEAAVLKVVTDACRYMRSPQAEAAANYLNDEPLGDEVDAT